jgi:dsDNA-binding SOS-regulon protein
MKIEGMIISGEFDKNAQEFTIQKIKNWYTETVVKEEQVEKLYAYLIRNKDAEEQILTLYDQLLVRLTKDEMSQLLSDLENVVSLYQ